MTRKTKVIIGAVVLLGVSSVAVARVAGGGEDTIAIRSAQVERLDLEAMVRASGWIQPRVAVDVQSDIMGRVTGLYVREGERVQKGQVLLRMRGYRTVPVPGGLADEVRTPLQRVMAGGG